MMIDISVVRAATLTLASVAVLSGCSESDPPAVTTAAALPATLQGLATDTLFEIGASQGESWRSFGGIWDVDVSSSGNTAVLDIESAQVHVYDSTGAHVGSVLTAGLDPGSLEAPSGLTWAGDDDLLVWDPGTSTISQFDVSTTGVQFEERVAAYAFGETGFCADDDHTYLSYWQNGLVVHEIGDAGVDRSFGTAPQIPGMSELGPELQEIGIEELSPSELLCTPAGVLDVAFFGSRIRLHDHAGTLVWEREFEEFNPLSVYSPDGMGLGRQFDATQGTSLLHSIVAWGADHALVQHEIRTREFLEEGEVPVLESRLIRLSDGAEVDRSRELPRILATWGSRFYVVVDDPFPRIVVLEVNGDPA
jgi:hypothetical protein